MKILHYALGFPPYRTGGLTKYCMDLMVGQKEQGHELALLWPGRISFINNKLSVLKNRTIDGIKSFEIINPLPVALDEGIIDIEAYMENCDKKVYRIFLEKYKPDVIHLHTLMGLHKEFLEATKELGIKTVFTTHDYYGFCPKVTLFCKGHTCDDDNGCRNCVECNQHALSMNKIILMQSSLYRKLKGLRVVKALRRRHRRNFFDDSIVEETQFSMTETEIEKKAKGYRHLRQYYIDIYSLIDTIHFNSTVAEKVYMRYFKPKNGKVISITHSGISDHRKKKEFHGKLKITYLAPAKPFKGFYILKAVLDELWEENHRDFELNVFSLTDKVSSYINIQDGYQYCELESIFNRTDILVAPSVWYETFGFTVIEAMSYGVPVLVSENVGAKDILSEAILVVKRESDLKNILKLLIYDRTQLANMNEILIKNKNNNYMFYSHVEKMVELYRL